MTPSLREMQRNWITNKLLMRMKNGTATLENSLALSSTNYTCYYGIHTPAVIFRSFIPENENYVHTKVCIWSFIATLFIIAPNWKQHRLSFSQMNGSTNCGASIPWIDSAVNRHELLVHTTAWMNLRELSWMNKAIPKRLHTIWFHSYTILEMTNL